MDADTVRRIELAIKTEHRWGRSVPDLFGVAGERKTVTMDEMRKIVNGFGETEVPMPDIVSALFISEKLTLLEKVAMTFSLGATWEKLNREADVQMEILRRMNGVREPGEAG